MGTINILKSAFNGKVGQIYGTKQNGKYYAKAVPFSHAPHNNSQKSAFSAFVCLNRFAQGIGKELFKYLYLSDKKMTKANAVAKFFKPAIKDKTFTPLSIAEVAEGLRYFLVYWAKVNSPNPVVDASIMYLSSFPKDVPFTAFPLIMEPNGNIMAYKKITSMVGNFIFNLERLPQKGSVFMIPSFTFRNNKWHFDNAMYYTLTGI